MAVGDGARRVEAARDDAGALSAHAGLAGGHRAGKATARAAATTVVGVGGVVGVAEAVVDDAIAVVVLAVADLGPRRDALILAAGHGGVEVVIAGEAGGRVAHRRPRGRVAGAEHVQREEVALVAARATVLRISDELRAVHVVDRPVAVVVDAIADLDAPVRGDALRQVGEHGQVDVAQIRTDRPVGRIRDVEPRRREVGARAVEAVRFALTRAEAEDRSGEEEEERDAQRRHGFHSLSEGAPVSARPVD